MEKKVYQQPHIHITQLTSSVSLLAGSGDEEVDWDPGTNTPIKTTQEKDGNLGEADSEISGAKSNNDLGGWNFWE